VRGVTIATQQEKKGLIEKTKKNDIKPLVSGAARQAVMVRYRIRRPFETPKG